MIVITGGGGFIGSVLAARLNEEGRSDLVIVDRFGIGDKWRNIAKRDFFEIVPVDGLFAWLDRFGDAVEAIFHLGAISSTTANDADAVIASKVNYTIALWRWCAAACKPLIYASSAATYRDGSAGFDDAGGIEGLKNLRPLNLYGWSKHAFDLWSMREASAGRAPPMWVGLKFFNVFGPNEYHKGDMMSLIAKNYRRITTGETIRLFKSHRPDCADGEQCRDFVYVKDCIAVLVWLWRRGLDQQRLQSRHGQGSELS
jgi:ADP-L-glycero-D-manno-heptose 6-epimerase